ncbi:NADH dehydrogenase [ubiquinone] 1 subunit C1, mitochondrial isoform X1 [Castor canadensis]|uniref:NADH dehydrogenase [ubiquinone] 1 subunit C1, mitochondrial isoform X1 n=1 Tax=Castor canadensis TaxID=51338 RepID=A0AC58JX78_CASCN
MPLPLTPERRAPREASGPRARVGNSLQGGKLLGKLPSLHRPLIPGHSVTPDRAGTATARWKFYVREPRHAHPNWLKVGLTLGTCAFLWGYLIKQHDEDVLEYKRRNGLE